MNTFSNTNAAGEWLKKKQLTKIKFDKKLISARVLISNGGGRGGCGGGEGDILLEISG